MAWRAGTVTRPPRTGWLVSNSVARPGEIPRQGKQAIAPAAVQGYDTAVTGATTLENVELLVRVHLQWVKRAAAQRGVGLAQRDELLVVGQQL